MSVRGMEDPQILEILKKSEGDSKWVSEEYDRLRTKLIINKRIGRINKKCRKNNLNINGYC